MGMKDYKEIECGECKIMMRREYRVPHIDVFNSYVEENMRPDGRSVFIRDKSHRDRLCKKYHASYDKSSNLKPKHKNISSLGEVGFDAWMQEMKRRGHV